MSAVVETTVSPHILTELAATYEFAHADTVRNFLVTRPSVASLLLQARDHIAKSFGPQTRTALDVVQDPEDQSSATLYAFIQTPDEPDEALERLDRFNDNWWRRALGSEAVPLHFTLEYV